MYFIDAYSSTESLNFLWRLLRERTPEQSISHVEMPTFDEHREFVESKPYLFWYIISVDDRWVGSIYFTRNREIGIFILNKYQGNGYGKQAIEKIRCMYPGPIYANVNPDNARSKKLFEDLGGKQIQVTYLLEDDNEKTNLRR